VCPTARVSGGPLTQSLQHESSLVQLKLIEQSIGGTARPSFGSEEDLGWDGMTGRKQSAAVRRLSACQGSLDQHVGRAEQSFPSWGLRKLGPSHRERQHQQHDLFDSGLAGGSCCAKHWLQLPIINQHLCMLFVMRMKLFHAWFC
jgi:hypothetical protein